MKRLRAISNFSLADLALAFGGAVGIILLAFSLSSHHPYGAGSSDESSERIEARALEFFEMDEESVTRVGFRPQDPVLLAMQHRYGREAAVDSIRYARDDLPLFLWRVRSQVDYDTDQATRARFDESGRLWSFSRPSGITPSVHRSALGAIQQWPDDGAEGVALSDTLMAEQFSYNTDSGWGSVDDSYDLGDGIDLEQGIGAAESLQMARYHLERMGHSPDAFVADSVWLAGSENTQVRARTRFVAEQVVSGYRAMIELETTAGGMLWAVESALEDDEGELIAIGSTTFQTGLSIQSAEDSIPVITYLILLFVMAIVFFRKLNERLIDVNTSLRDAVLGGTLLAFTTTLPLYEGLQTAIEGVWPRLGIFTMSIIILGIAGGALIFVISAATDSGMRSIWPEKIKSLNLARRFRFYNIPVGLSLLRGVGLAGWILGLLMAMLYLAPGATMLLGERGVIYLSDPIISPFLFSVAVSGWTALWVILLVYTGILTLAYRKVRSQLFVAAVAVVLGGLLQFAPIAFEAQILNVTVSAIVGLVIALVFLRFDAFTAFVGLFLAGVIWWSGPAWMVLGLFSFEGGLPWLLFATAIGVGVAGVASGRDQEEVENYVPTYVRDLSQRERLQHEIELAQQVQQNLLPRSMPRIPGLDLAALCLPAQEVGGDYYDLIQVGPRQIGVVVGDVSGKGIQAAFFMTLAKGFLQTLARQQRSPREVVTRLNRLFCDNVPRGTFISMVYGVVDLDAQTFTFVRAGHNPLVQREARTTESTLRRPEGMAIGLTSSPIFEDTLQEVTVKLQEGDALVLYTDGFTEAVNVQGTQLGSGRFTSYIDSASTKSAQKLLDDVQNSVARFIDGAPRHDDMTVVVLQLSSIASKQVIDIDAKHVYRNLSPTVSPR